MIFFSHLKVFREEMKTSQMNNYRPWDEKSLVLNLIGKVEPGFFTFLNVHASGIQRDKILISELSPSKFRYLADQNEPKGEPHENELWRFLNTKMNITNS